MVLGPCLCVKAGGALENLRVQTAKTSSIKHKKSIWKVMKGPSFATMFQLAAQRIHRKETDQTPGIGEFD